MRVVAVMVLASGCSFDPSPAVPEDGPIASIDTPDPDATPESGCLAAWRAHTVRTNTPVPLTEVNSIAADRDPFVSADEKTILFGARGAVTNEVFQATRASATADFDTPTLAMDLSSADGDESKATLRGDGLEVFVASTRANGAGGTDLWTATRTDAATPFPALTNLALNDLDNQFDPELSASGLHLYYSQGSAPQHIVVTARTSLTAAFTEPITVVESGVGDADPSVSPDELVLVFSSNRVGSGFGGGNIWYATRNATTEPFGTPAPLPGVNGNTNDGDPVISSDGCRLYFASDRGITGFDLFVADVIR